MPSEPSTLIDAPEELEAMVPRPLFDAPDSDLPGAAEYPTVKDEPIEVKQEIKEEPLDDDYEDANGYEKYEDVKDEPIADVSVLGLFSLQFVPIPGIFFSHSNKKTVPHLVQFLGLLSLMWACYYANMST